MDISSISYKSDCRYFRGDVPCKPHKEFGYHCDDCKLYQSLKNIILIIKLGAIGDVIRTTPLLSKIRSEHPESAIWWLTYSPEIVPDSVERVLNFTAESILAIQSTEFFKVLNLDKDIQACALTNQIKATEKFGFYLLNGKPAPINKFAEAKFQTGLFDDVNQANTKSYPQEIFEICGWNFKGEEYVLDFDGSISWDIPNNSKKIIGLNTGCGGRWTTRLWSYENWVLLIKLLQVNNYFPILLGGQQEDSKNKQLETDTGAYYPGFYSLQEFTSLVNQCDTVVTAVTMGMHIAIGLKKPVVLMNNIFNPNEFELYGRGEIVQPDKACTCYFSPRCKNKDYFCMDHLLPDTIFKAIDKIFK
jgi:heptosyltransferase-2